MNRLHTTLALVGLLASPAALSAQAPPTEEPVTDEGGSEEEDATTAEEAPPEDDAWSEPAPPRQPPPPPPPAPVVEEEVVVEDDGGVDWLPSDRLPGSFGLGFGWTFPGLGGDLWTPSTIAARFRLDGGLAIEPSLIIRASGSGDNEDSTDDPRAMQIGVGTQVRIPAASAGPVDFLILGNVNFNTNLDIEPGDSRSLSLNVGYGLGLELWLAGRFSIGMDATNALASVTWSSVDNLVTGETDKATSWAVGVVWNPQLRLLATLYF
jgi:opacity protein-like surface antigen